MLKHGLSLAALLFLCASVMPQGGPQEPELDFIRGLRKRGWNDLALQRLQQLQARTQPPLPADWKQLIPLEIAKTQAAIAGKLEDAGERDRLIETARRDLDAFVKNPANANNPALGDGYFDLARLTTEKANTKAAEARHAADAQQKEAETKQAVALFAAADAAFKEASKRLEERYKKVEDSKNAAERQAALEAYLDSLFQQGLMTFQLSEVHGNTQEGGEALRASSKAFDALSSYRTKTDAGPAVMSLGWQGFAWYGRTMLELDQTKGQAAYAQIERERKPEAVVAQRLVRYFRLVGNFRASAPAATRNPVLAEAEKWLKDFPAAYNSAEGQHVRFLVGLMYLDELDEVKDPQRKRTPAYEALVNKATNHLNELEKHSSRYGTVATNLKLRVRFVSGQAINSPIAQLKSFEDCLLRADYEYQQAVEAEKNAKGAENAEELKKKAATHIVAVIEAARKAIAVMPETVKDEQWERAYALLYAAYLNTNDYPRATIIMDYLARNTRKPEDAQMRTIAALSHYRAFAQQGDAYARQQLVSIAGVLEQRYPKAAEIENARDILGFELLRNKKFREGATTLAKVTEKYPDFPKTSYWAGRILWNLHFQAMREAKKSVQSPSPDRDLAIHLLTRCIAAAESAKPPQGKLAVEARVGLAEIYNQLAQPDEVLKLVTPLVAGVQHNTLPPDVEQGTATQVLGLALRANIQKKDIDGAVKVLDVLQKQGGQEDIGKGLAGHLGALGQQLKAEIENLSALGDAERLRQTKDSFARFLEHLDKDPKLTPETRLWVGSNYGVLGEHEKAAQVFAKVNDATPPKHPQNNLAAQLLYHAALRQAGAAADPSRKEELFKTAEAELKKAMDDSEKIRKHPAFIKEQIHLKQERGMLSGVNGAISGWDKLRQALEPHIERSAQFKQIYLDASYNLVWCLYHEARQIQNPSVRKEALDRAAQKLRAFQQIDDLKPRLEELLNDTTHKDLKEAYARLGRAAVK